MLRGATQFQLQFHSNFRQLPILSSITISTPSKSSSCLLHALSESKTPLFSPVSSLPTTAHPPSPSSPSSRWGPPMTSSRSSPELQRRVLCSSSTIASDGSGSNGVGREGKEVLVQHLLVDEKDLKLLIDLERKIAGGEDLSDLAVDHSLCPSKQNGGMLGWVRKGQMVPEFEEAAFNAPLEKVVRCKTKFGWHLLQVLSEREECVLDDIEPEKLYSKMQDPTFVEEAQLIDVREPEEIARASLPGFKVLPLRQFGTWGTIITDEFDPQKDTYVMCHHGMRSMQVAKWLQTQGFKKVFNVAGGIHAYAVKADSSVPTY